MRVIRPLTRPASEFQLTWSPILNALTIARVPLSMATAIGSLAGNVSRSASSSS
jgi:hypothetical protein